MARPTHPVPPKLAKEVVALTMQLHQRKLWLEFDEYDAFAIRLPGDEQPSFVSMMGSGGQQFGFACYSGLDGLRELRQLVFVGGDDSRAFHSEILVVTVDPQRAIPDHLRDVYRAAGHQEPLAPSFMRVGPGDGPRSARKPELRRVCAVVRALLLADDRGLLRTSPLARSGGSRLLTLTVEDGDVRARFENYLASPDELQSGLISPPELAGLRRSSARWSVGFRHSPVQVADEDQTMFALLVHEPAQDRILMLKIVAGDDVEAPATLLLNLMQVGGNQSEPGLPAAVAFASRRLHDAVAPMLSEVGVETRFEPDQPELDLVFERLQAELGGGADEELSAADRTRRALASRVVREIQARGLLTARRRADFFGEGDEAAAAESDFAMTSLIEWLLLDHRPSARHRTLAEKLLAAQLPDDERAILQARVDAAPSVYRTEEIDGDHVTLADLFTDRKIRIEDPGLAASVPVGTMITGRVCGAGSAGFLSLLAPPFRDIDADRAFAFLESLGMEMSAAGIRRAPHLFGRLFGWFGKRRTAAPPQMQNTDGEPLRLMNASFRCADPQAASRALAALDDVEFDDDQGSWSWFREGTGAGRTLLGRLEPIGDRLVLEVNSDGRLARARVWLERIPGVQFESATEQDLAAAHPSRSAPGGGVELTPELIEKLQELLRERYRAWIDESIPALDGLSPREAVKTPDGRRRVELLIKTMPDPAGTPGVKAPRDEIRRELGLDRDPGLEQGAE